MNVSEETSEAVLSSDRKFTSFSFGGHVIRFQTSPRLEKYTQIVQWDHGYLVVKARYEGSGEEEDYIDLIPILRNLYFDAESFLAPIRKVRIAYV